VAKGKRTSPGIGRAGHNSGLPSIADVRTALAIEMVFEEEAKKLREKHKRARKRIEGMGVRLDDLSFLKGMRDKTGTEVVDEFKRHWHLVGAIHEDQTEQLDIFAPRPSAPEVRHAHYTMGLMAGLQGKELEIPPMIQGDDRDQMIKGHNEGREKREAARLLTLEEALGNAEDGKVTDGTGKGKGTAAKVGEQAAADFAKDQAAAGADDPLVVNGERYATIRQANAARSRLQKRQEEDAVAMNPEDGRRSKFWDAFPEDSAAWTEEQRDAFCTWFDKLPADAVVEIDHAGAAAEYARLKEATSQADVVEASGFLADPAPIVGDDVKPAAEDPPPAPRAVARPDFHAWDEDWMKWSGPQQMEFRRWFEGLPASSVPAITHPGAVAYFRLLREEQENRAAAGPGDEDDWGEEGKAEAEPAPAPEPEVDLSPEALDAKAKALAESGFVPPKNTRRGKKA
jgi:hypothetical protein